MAEAWRLILEDSDDPVFHLASLEALWRSLDEGPAPNTFILRRLSPCVMIGSTQEPTREVDLGECRRRGIPVLRRPSEGGAIYCDPDCLVFSLICRRGPQSAVSSEEALTRLGSMIATAIQRLGIARKACFASPNDITVGGKKVAGLTMTDWYGIRSFSGALLLDYDLETMSAVLTPAVEKLENHCASGIGDRLTTLRHCLDRPLAADEVTKCLIATVGTERSLTFRRESLSTRERESAETLRKQKYAHPAWNRTDSALETS